MLQTPQPNEYPIMPLCRTHRIGSKYKYGLRTTLICSTTQPLHNAYRQSTEYITMHGTPYNESGSSEWPTDADLDGVKICAFEGLYSLYGGLRVGGRFTGGQCCFLLPPPFLLFQHERLRGRECIRWLMIVQTPSRCKWHLFFDSTLLPSY